MKGRFKRMLTRAKYAAIGGAVGGAIGGLVSRNAASSAAGLGALIGATVGEKSLDLDNVVGKAKEKTQSVKVRSD